jgi:type III restriction enzyme
MDRFSGLPIWIRQQLAEPESGRVALSLANVMKLHRRHCGPFELRKHAFDLVGEMGDEESQCAKRINDHPNVKRWVRNVSYESAGGFSLPLSPGRFFPDFIAEFVDGRLAIIEYKGKHLAPLADELHKKEVGELWAGRSEGDCVFIWVVDRDWATLETALAARG